MAPSNRYATRNVLSVTAKSTELLVPARWVAGGSCGEASPLLHPASIMHSIGAAASTAPGLADLASLSLTPCP